MLVGLDIRRMAAVVLPKNSIVEQPYGPLESDYRPSWEVIAFLEESIFNLGCYWFITMSDINFDVNSSTAALLLQYLFERAIFEEN